MFMVCSCAACRAERRRFLRGFAIGLAILLAAFALIAPCGGCATKPQQGGKSGISFGGGTAPSVVTSAAPENPHTPSTTTMEKTITREFAPAEPRPETRSTSLQNPTSHGAEAAAVESSTAGASKVPPSPPSASAPKLVREVVVEKATTQTGTAQQDTARDLSARLANMRGVQWVGVALLVLGPLAGWRLGWLTNGLIAGAVGLLLIVLAQVLPGHEAWFALGGLLIIPLVCFAYYKAHHDARTPSASS